MNGQAVRTLEVRTDGLVGAFVAPDASRGPGLLALSGSDGGCHVYMARLLAEQGFPCLALRYFGARGLPRQLVEVPIDYIEVAIQWLRDRPEVTGGRIGIVGASKGAELALLSAALMPDRVGAVVGYAPSSVAFAGISMSREGRRRSSWTWRGSALPFVPYPESFRPSVRLRGLSLAPVYQLALANSEAVASAAIAIERSEAAILLISGDRDRMWPSSAMAGDLVSRLGGAGKGDLVEHLRYADAGHSFMPWRPNSGPESLGKAIDAVRMTGWSGIFDLGGQPKANKEALHHAWPQVVAFLRRHAPFS